MRPNPDPTHHPRLGAARRLLRLGIGRDAEEEGAPPQPHSCATGKKRTRDRRKVSRSGCAKPSCGRRAEGHILVPSLEPDSLVPLEDRPPNSLTTLVRASTTQSA
jgi:hypothetical protein